MEIDYPRLTDAADNERDEDRAIAVAYLTGFAPTRTEREDARLLAHRALNLLPPMDFVLVLPLLESTDMWVQERACEVLGLWRRAEAVPHLLRVGRTGMHNGQIAAVRALRRIATPEARAAIGALQSELGSRFEWLFSGTLTC